MIPMISLSNIEAEIKNRYKSSEKLLGIMLANYNVDFVKEIISQCYTSWNIEAGSDFDIYWPGYGYLPVEHYNSSGIFKTIPPLVNFNADMPIHEVKRLIEDDKDFTRQALREGMFTFDSRKTDVLEKLENHGQIRFYEKEYIEAKRYIRSALNLSQNQKVDSMTLLLLNYTGDDIQYDRENSIVLTLTELYNTQLPITSINDLVSELNAYCVDANSFDDIKKAAKPILKRGKQDSDWKTKLSLFLTGLQTLGGLVVPWPIK